MAVRAHDPRHCGSAGALSAGERTQAIDTEAFEVLVRSGADDDCGPASGGQDVAGDRGPIGRSTSMISRELRRNADPTAGRYLPATADRLAAARVARPRPRRVARDAQLHAVVVELLGKRWSPEQVAHDLRQRFPDHRARQLCTESIYQAIYDVTVEVTRPAKRRRRHRRRRIQGLERRGRLTGMTMIADRPADVDDRVQVGHWEGDCIMGAGNRSAIGTLVERHTRFLALIPVPLDQPTAQAIRDGICSAMADLPPHLGPG